MTFHDLTGSDRVRLYFSIGQGQKNYEVTYNFAVPTAPVLAYHNLEILNQGQLCDLVFQIVYAEWALLIFLAFMKDGLDGVTVFSSDPDARGICRMTI